LNLLLLLSAMLSALTGIGATRAEAAPAAAIAGCSTQSAATRCEQAPLIRTHGVLRPAPTLSRNDRGVFLRLASTTPIYADRRRI